LVLKEKEADQHWCTSVAVFQVNI